MKTKISEDRSIDLSSQVLICAGKTLKDEDALASSVSAAGFLVLMVKVSSWFSSFLVGGGGVKRGGERERGEGNSAGLLALAVKFSSWLSYFQGISR